MLQSRCVLKSEATTGEVMKIRRKKLPLPGTPRKERQREVELELPLPPPPERPGMSRKVEPEPERGEMVIDMFGSDDPFCI